MTPQYILRKSLCRDPYCFRAHVPGQGYVNRGDGSENSEERREFLRQYRRAATSEIENMQWALAYAEPGYDQPKRGILFANWNNLAAMACDLLERYGFACEWSDEWTTCDDCGNALRVSPNGYSWQPAYIEMDGSTFCPDCADYSEYLRNLEDDPKRACFAHVDPADYGYTRLSEPDEFENGFHYGQTDDPAKILAALHAEGKRGIVFRVSDTGQFDIAFETWQRREDSDGNEGDFTDTYQEGL